MHIFWTSSLLRSNSSFGRATTWTGTEDKAGITEAPSDFPTLSFTTTKTCFPSIPNIIIPQLHLAMIQWQAQTNCTGVVQKPPIRVKRKECSLNIFQNHFKWGIKDQGGLNDTSKYPLCNVTLMWNLAVVEIKTVLLATDLLTCTLLKWLKYLQPASHKLVSEQK